MYLPEKALEMPGGSGGLRVLFQPIFDLATMRPLGYEALARTGGQFGDVLHLLADAARHGRLAEAEAAICRLVLSTAAPLMDDGALVFINLETASFLNCLGGKAAEIFAGRGRSVVLEITEHGFGGEYAGMRDAAGRWREMGVKLAVDDVSSGYDRLRNVLRLDPEYVKFDWHLVHRCHREARQREMMRGLLQIATALGASVIGEGVETAMELNVLRKLGIPAAQGYFLARPGSIEEFAGRGAAGRWPSSMGGR